jgi:hypothetical protein
MEMAIGYEEVRDRSKERAGSKTMEIVHGGRGCGHIYVS